MLAACGTSAAPEPSATPAPTLTPTPAGPQELTVCSGEEPQSLYLYADNSAAAQSIRQTIYDGPFDLVNGQSVGTLFAQTPSLENNGLRLEAISVQSGDLVVDAAGNLGRLYAGMSVRPAGCRDGDCAVVYESGELLMDQQVLAFDLIDDPTWADGTPLSANDSVFSFRIASDPATPGSKSAIQRTASYQALDESSLEWRGLPGYLDAQVADYFWPPLPEHLLGSYSAEELLTLEAANRTPLGWGAYNVENWAAGEAITLSRNPHYFRSGEELPHFETLTIRFTGQDPQFNLQALQDGECDLLLPSTGIDEENARINEMTSTGEAQAYYGESGAWWHLDFGLQPYAYDDGYNLFNERADFFSLPEMRQAFALCVDRNVLRESFAFGKGELPNSYVAPSHALNNANAAAYSFDPQAGAALLEAAGWLPGEDGIRTAQAAETALFGTRLSLRLYTINDDSSLAIAQSIKNSLDDCGIELEIISDSPAVIFAPGPNGPLFGRDFDLALFAWPTSEQPACYLFTSEAIPGPDSAIYRYAWGGWNLSGWSNADYDASCTSAMNALPSESAYSEGHAQAQNIFAEQLPALPLFVAQQVALSRADFCGFDFSSGDPLANIEEFGFAEWCR